MWIRRHPVRTGIYAAMLAGAVVIALRAGPIAAWVVNGPAGRAIAQRLGVSFRAANVTIGRGAVEIAGLDAAVEGDPAFRFTADRVRADGLRSIVAAKVSAGGTIKVDDSAIDVPGQSVRFTGARFADAVTLAQGSATLRPVRFEGRGLSGFGTVVDSISAGPIELGRQEIRVTTAEAAGVRIAASRDILDRAATLEVAARQLEREAAALRTAYSRLSSRARDLLWWAIVIVACAIAAAKLVLTYGGIAARAVSAAAVLIAPFAAQRFGIYASLAAIAIAALALLVAIYRRAPEWHQWAEPLAVDLLGPALLAGLLAAYAFTWPALPDPPAMVLRVDNAVARDIAVSVGDGPNRFAVAIPRLVVSGLRAAQTAEVRNVSAANTSVAGAGWRVVLRELDASGIQASQSGGSASRVVFRGEAEAGGALGRIAFAGNATASAPPIRYGVDASIRGQGLNVSLRADGNAEAADITRIRVAPPTVVRIADGTAHVALARTGAATLTLRGLEIPNAARIDSVLANASYSENRAAVEASTRGLAFRSPDGAVTGDIPRTDTRLEAALRGNTVDAEVRFSSSRLTLAGPLRFSIDTRARSLDIPDQRFIVSQTIVRRAPETIEGALGFTGRLGKEANLRLRIPRLAPEVEPLGLELNGFELTAALGEGAPRIAVETGWNRIRYPAVPQPNRLESVDRLLLKVRVNGDLFGSAPAIPAIPALPERFRVAGVWPDLRVVTDTEQRLPLDGFSARLGRLTFPGSAFESGEFDFALRERLQARVSLTRQATAINASGSVTGVGAFEASVVPGRLDFTAANARAAVKYSPGRIDEVDGKLALDAGPLVDLPAARIRLGAPARIAFLANSSGASADLDAPAFEFHAKTLSAEGGVATALRLAHATERGSPILDALERAARSAEPHFQRARALVDIPAPSQIRIAARNTDGQPFLRFARDRVELRGAFEADSIQSGDIAADLVARDRVLFVDAATAAVPILLAIRDPFPERQRTPDALLWDPAAIESAWNGFTPRHALHPQARAVVALGDRIQVHAPVAAPLLFGSSATTAQAELAWNGNSPAVTARLDGAFQNVQAGAVGLEFAGVRHALLEDSFDGVFRASVNGLALTPESLARWRGDPWSFDAFDKIGFSLDATRSKNQAGPGILQLSVDTRVRLLNEFLRRISNSLRFRTPPQVLTYRGLHARVSAANGVVQTKLPILELSGVRVLSTELLDVTGDFRVHLGDRLASDVSLSSLVRFAMEIVR